MKTSMHEFIALARFVKSAAEEEKKDRKQMAKPTKTPAYPDYGRSLVAQGKKDPHRAGMQRGASSALVGAILSALLARMATKNPLLIGGAALGGGALGGRLGYTSGSEEAKSDFTRLLALRRLGLQTPAEYESALAFPELTQRLTTPGVRL